MMSTITVMQSKKHLPFHVGKSLINNTNSPVAFINFVATI